METGKALTVEGDEGEHGRVALSAGGTHTHIDALKADQDGICGRQGGWWLGWLKRVMVLRRAACSLGACACTAVEGGV